MDDLKLTSLTQENINGPHGNNYEGGDCECGGCDGPEPLVNDNSQTKGII